MQNVSNSRPNKLKGRKSYKASAFSLLLNSHAVEKANRLKTIAAFTQRRQVHLHGESIGDCWGQIFAADRDPRLRLSSPFLSVSHCFPAIPLGAPSISTRACSAVGHGGNYHCHCQLRPQYSFLGCGEHALHSHDRASKRSQKRKCTALFIDFSSCLGNTHLLCPAMFLTILFMRLRRDH